MSQVSLVVGNGFSISFAAHSKLINEFNSQQPLDWNIKCPTTGKLLIDSFPSLKMLWQSSRDEKHFDIFKLALNQNHCQHFGLDSAKTILEARHFLTIAFSEYSLLQKSRLCPNWSWFKWLKMHKDSINGALSFNYDLLLETIFDELEIEYCSLQVNHGGSGIPLVKPHGSVDFEIADGIIDLGRMQYPLKNFFIDENDIPIKRLESNNLIYPRTQAHCIIPNEANKYKDYQWVKPANSWLETILKESKYCLFIGISYLPCDQDEIDRIIDTLPESCEIIIANPYPSEKLLKKLENRQLTVWKTLDGPIDEHGNLYNLN